MLFVLDQATLWVVSLFGCWSYFLGFLLHFGLKIGLFHCQRLCSLIIYLCLVWFPSIFLCIGWKGFVLIILVLHSLFQIFISYLRGRKLNVYYPYFYFAFFFFRFLPSNLLSTRHSSILYLVKYVENIAVFVIIFYNNLCAISSILLTKLFLFPPWSSNSRWTR